MGGAGGGARAPAPPPRHGPPSRLALVHQLHQSRQRRQWALVWPPRRRPFCRGGRGALSRAPRRLRPLAARGASRGRDARSRRRRGRRLLRVADRYATRTTCRLRGRCSLRGRHSCASPGVGVAGRGAASGVVADWGEQAAQRRRRRLEGVAVAAALPPRRLGRRLCCRVCGDARCRAAGACRSAGARCGEGKPFVVGSASSG